MLKSSRFALLAAAVTLTAVVSSAQVHKEPTPTAPAIGKVVANFQLKQIATGLYTAKNAVLTFTSCEATPKRVRVKVDVELRTTTTLNKCGDGLTDGVLTLYAAGTTQVIMTDGSLVAINENNGVLTGTLEGEMMGPGSASLRVRAAFNGVFVQDAAGAWTLIDVDARGVTVTE